jgi:Tfp pilus assembly protein FimT
LVELLLVVGLIGILIGVTYPRLNKSVRSREHVDSVDRLGALVRFVRKEAVRKGRRTRLCFEPGGTGYWVEIQHPEAIHAEHFTEFGDSLLDKRRTFPVGIQASRLLEGSGVQRLHPIVFSPDGLGQPCTLVLGDGISDSWYIQLGSWYEELSITRELSAISEVAYD